MNLIDAIWFTSLRGTVGIVIGEDEVTGKRKAYVGIGDGFDEKVDAEHILEWGCPLYPGTIHRIFPDIFQAGVRQQEG